MILCAVVGRNDQNVVDLYRVKALIALGTRVVRFVSQRQLLQRQRQLLQRQRQQLRVPTYVNSS